MAAGRLRRRYLQPLGQRYDLGGGARAPCVVASDRPDHPVYFVIVRCIFHDPSDWRCRIRISLPLPENTSPDARDAGARAIGAPTGTHSLRDDRLLRIQHVLQRFDLVGHFSDGFQPRSVGAASTHDGTLGNHHEVIRPLIWATRLLSSAERAVTAYNQPRPRRRPARVGEGGRRAAGRETVLLHGSHPNLRRPGFLGHGPAHSVRSRIRNGGARTSRGRVSRAGRYLRSPQTSFSARSRPQRNGRPVAERVFLVVVW